jgi:phosphoglycerate dehydrogenase-like enzyme
VGYGNIGKEVAIRALAFGMSVVVSDPRDPTTLDNLNG